MNQLLDKKFCLGSLCKDGHEYGNSGQTLYYSSCKKCVECNRLSQLRRKELGWVGSSYSIRYPRVPCVYAIKVEGVDGVYIGSTKTLAFRWSAHKSDLAKRRHNNPNLQKLYDQNGLDIFSIIVLEVVEDESDIKFVEQMYMDCAVSLLNVSRSAFVRIAPNPNTSEWNRTSKKGNQYWVGRTHSKESKLKMIQAKGGGMRQFVSPDGEVHEVLFLREFCESYGLNPSHMAAVFSGKAKQHKGWTKHKEQSVTLAKV